MDEKTIITLYILCGMSVTMLFLTAADHKERKVPFFALVPIFVLWPVFLIVVPVLVYKNRKQHKAK